MLILLIFQDVFVFLLLQILMSVIATLTTATGVQTVPTLQDLSSALVNLGTLEMVLFAVMVRSGLHFGYAHTQVIVF